MNSSTNTFDVIIVGGSYAGLSAAMVLGRALRTVLVIDNGQPANRQTPHSHSFLTRDGESPAQLATIARQQALAYPTVQFREATATSANRSANGFSVTVQTGETFSARWLLLATGLEDGLPSIPGFAECWGISVLHCPYCHGFEVKDKVVGVLGNGDAGFELAKLIYHWNPGLRLFTNGASTLSDDQTMQLKSHGIQLVETSLVGLEQQNGQLQALRLADQTTVSLDALYARPTIRQKSNLAEQLGCQLNEAGFIVVDGLGKTTVEGVYAAGDNHTMLRQVAFAASNGLKAAVAITKEMMDQEF